MAEIKPDQCGLLQEDIDAWVEEQVKAGETTVPDFWEELETSVRLAGWLAERGWRRAPEKEGSDDLRQG